LPKQSLALIGGAKYFGVEKEKGSDMTWIIMAVIAYLLIGGLIFFLVSLTDEYNPKKWIPTFVLTVFL